MALWIWGLVSWAATTTVAAAYLAAVCTGRRRAARAAEPAVENEWLPGFDGEGNPAEPVRRASATEAPDPAPSDGAGPSSHGPSTQPMTRLLPAAAGGGPRYTEVPDTLLGRLVDGARPGGYTLPESLVDLHRAARRLRDLALSAPPPVGREGAVARLVDVAMDSGPLDPMGLCAEMHRFRTDRLLHQEALELLRAATRTAEDAAVHEAAAASDAIITEHLRPAYREVLRRARDVVRRLGPYIDDRCRLDTARVMTASRRVRIACLALPGLVAEHSRILAARDCANALGERFPQCDRRGLFSVFEDPFALAAASGGSYDDIPVPPLPADDTARLVWLVSAQGGAGRPWLPTVAEQDAAWRMHFDRPAAAMPVVAAD